MASPASPRRRPSGRARSQVDPRGGLFGGLPIRLKPPRGVDDERVAFSADREAIYAARRMPGDERLVGLIPRVVLRALEARVLRQPLERGVLMRARERERVRMHLV